MGLFKEKEDYYYMSWNPSRRIDMHEDVLKEFFKICKEVGLPLAKEPIISTEYMFSASFNLVSEERGDVCYLYREGCVTIDIYRKTKTGCSEDKIDSIFYETLQRIICCQATTFRVLKNNYNWYDFHDRHTPKHTYMD